MLKLNASYSKKVPAGKSIRARAIMRQSRSNFRTGVTQDQLQARIHETFDLVRNSVEAELHGNDPRNYGTYPASNGSKNASARQESRRPSE